KNNKPDCTVNPAINKGGTAFSFRTANCPSGSTCVRALVLALDNTDVIPDGSTLYTCNVTTSGSGGTIAVSGSRLSTPAGSAITGTTSQDGKICIPGGPIETPTTPPVPPSATPTKTAIPPTTPPTATSTVKPSATATATIRPTTSGTATAEDEGGCQINALGTSSSGWLLLIPVAAMLVFRRRSH
ncbi:MAG: hypothetical protein HY270_14450, partial [Deltaproteobacteria bacterium]|nr:hypothetical protein [Deltaproteobacteria bacterium]